jgi:hypothetical protein
MTRDAQAYRGPTSCSTQLRDPAKVLAQKFCCISHFPSAIGTGRAHFLARARRVKTDVADLQKLLFETPAQVSDREILAAARLNARVKTFAGCELSHDIVEQINDAVAHETDQLIAEGVLSARPDWLAVIVRRRLYVAFGSRAVQQLSRELKQMGAFE